MEYTGNEPGSPVRIGNWHVLAVNLSLAAEKKQRKIK
jgi:hypothetical protein